MALDSPPDDAPAEQETPAEQPVEQQMEPAEVVALAAVGAANAWLAFSLPATIFIGLLGLLLAGGLLVVLFQNPVFTFGALAGLLLGYWFWRKNQP